MSSSQASPKSTQNTASNQDSPKQEATIDSTTTAVGLKTVPPPDAPRKRTLILCFDGTGDQFDNDASNSNIVQLCSMLVKTDKTKQLVYYQPGIGTYTSPEIATPISSKIAKLLDEMVAWSLDAHVMKGYEFLMEQYTDGDRICIFGFSRGAYTARSLAGMIHKVGLLPAGNYQQVPFAYKMYTRADEIGWKQSNAFKAAFSIDVDIEFIGVWDTVNSVGLIPHRLPFTTSNTIVRTFRHAVSLDERRAKFKANLWNRPNAEERKLGTGVTVHPPVAAPVAEGHGATDALKKLKRPTTSWFNGSETLQAETIPGVDDRDDDRELYSFEDRFGHKSVTPTDVKEVWFAGCHCDVGGGSVSNETTHSLARISLRWMIRECFRTYSGILFDADKLRSIGLDPTALYPLVLPVPPPLSTKGSTIRKISSDSDSGTKGKDSNRRIPSMWMNPQPASAVEGLRQRLPSKPSDTTTTSEVPVISETNDHGHGPPSGSITSELIEEYNDALSPIYDQLVLAPHWWVLELLPIKQTYQRRDNSWGSSYEWNLGRGRVIPAQDTGGAGAGGFFVHRSVKMRLDADMEEGRGTLGKYKPKANFRVEPTWVD